MEADMRKPVHGMIAGASVATAFALTVAVAAAQTPAPQFDLTKVTDQVYSFRVWDSPRHGRGDNRRRDRH